MVAAATLVRFWGKVQKGDDCWEWTAGTTRDGYGQFRLAGAKRVRAHRLSYTIANGPIAEGMLVCHRCDNPACVNPAHLFLGTDADNRRDSSRKGRAWRPSERPVCKRGHALTPDNVIERTHRGYAERICRECSKMRSRARRARVKAEMTVEQRLDVARWAL